MRPLLLLIALASCAASADAQTGPTPGPAVATLGEALRTLAEARGVSLAYPLGDVVIVISYASMPIEEARRYKPVLVFPTDNRVAVTV